MQKKRFWVFHTAMFEIFLLISMSFAIAFILDENLVSGQGEALQPTLEQLGATPAEIAQLTTAGPAEASSANLGLKEFTIDWAGSTGGNLFVAHLIEGVFWGGLVALGIKFLGPMLGLDESEADALSAAAFGGIVAGKATLGLFSDGGAFALGSEGVIGPGLASFGVGAVVAVVIFVLMYKKEKKKLVTFECLPFEAPVGGEKCEECNNDPFRPCSEYRCKSLGQACELLNPGTTEEVCEWVNPRDVVSPTIQAWDGALEPNNLKYNPDNTIRPPNRGVKIVNEGGGCLPAFTPLEFGVTIDEPAKCKLDYNHTNSFDEMQFYFGGSNYNRYNHTQKMKLPGPDDSEVGELAPELENDGTFSLFVRCQDANGNENVDEFVFNFCVDQSEDTTPPIIVGTSITSGSPIRSDAEEVPIQVYVNEPAECRWSKTSKNYGDMENEMICATETYQINADLNYVCSGNLSITNKGGDNDFYFRCKDQPNKEENKRNVMTESYPLELRGSQPLNILSVGPNGTIFGNTQTIEVDLTVRTDDGAEEGKALCYLSKTGEPSSYTLMAETNSHEHKQNLNLGAGDYKYFFRCIDAGGNSAERDTSFNVVIDKEAPIITRAYRATGLKIVTNENAECVYSLDSCNYEFEEGLPMIYSNPNLKKQHFTEWVANSVYYIKCKDLYGNKPGPNECNMVVKSVELGVGN